ncbi:MAG TPA: ribonuclease HII, partial [Thermoanaerobaculia bacterium]|nr:ribonuclease HII [Thermoanaerobaculia bacterium]
MARTTTHLSVEELRRRFVQGGEPVSGQLLNRLRRDRRHGVRQIHDLLRRRLEREREERLRLNAMLNFERVLWKSGVTRIAGVDEAGVGPLAGPVVAAAVVFPPGAELAGVDDSKLLSPERREELAEEIRSRAAVAVGLAEVGEIDRLNVYHAALLAMRRAVEALPEPPEHLLVDAREVPEVPCPQNRFDKGDGINFSIAAASIVAKTHRDRLMAELDRRHPEYGFARHKGYGTA